MLVSRAVRLVCRQSLSSERGAQGTRWLQQSSVRSCSCSDPPPTTKPFRATKSASKTSIPAADHRDLGASLNLFSITKYSPGSPLFHPDGSHIFLKLQAFLRAQYAAFGFQEVVTPTIYKNSLWVKSGHFEHYRDDMFEVTGRGSSGNTQGGEIGEDESYGLKPMNCPGHCLLFKSQQRSYRDLPIRFADFSPLHRNEISGALSGLTRVRRFHQDDGHIFCRPSQVRHEIESTLQLVGMIYGAFGLGPYKLVLSTRPEKHFLGEPEEWARAEAQLKEALDASGTQWELNPGDGAFYGPKIDIILKDSDGKSHQTATIQLDFQLSRRFGLYYHHPNPELEAGIESATNPSLPADNTKARPVIIHRAVLGSLERFMALLIEHCKGRWPFWLSPRQAMIIPVDSQPSTLEYANKVAASLNGFGKESRGRLQPLNEQTFKVDTDLRDETLGAKIRYAKVQHYNLTCIVGGEEVKSGTVSVDITGQPDVGKVLEKCKEIVGRLVQPRSVSMDPKELKKLMIWMCEEYV